MDSLAFGWNPEAEGQHKIVESDLSNLCAAGPVPDNFDLDQFVQRLQYMWPFCHSFMRTGIVKALTLLRYGKLVDYAPRFAAITDMRMDGDDSVPSGASINGSLNGSIKFGEALETELPYFPNVPQNQLGHYYDNRISQAILDDAHKRHIGKIQPGVRSYQTMINGLTSGRVAIGLGMDWFGDLTELQGVDKYDAIPRQGSIGGHAVMVFGWRKYGGELWPVLHNSHPKWGVRQRVAFSPKFWDWLLPRTRFGCFLVSDIQNDELVEGRPWDWVETASFSSDTQIQWV